MEKYSLFEISKIINGSLIGNPKSEVSSIFIDSRRILIGDQVIFIAIKGINNDGHKFITQLVSKGVKNFVVNQEFVTTDLDQSINFVVVRDTLNALQNMAKDFRTKFNYPILGITGSNGKTTVKEWISHLAGSNIVINKSPKSYNSQVGVPLSLLMFERQSDLGIVEAGISLRGEMELLEDIIQPDWGLITNIGQAHQENFENIDEKLNEKLKLFSGCKRIFACADHDQVITQLKNKYGGREIILFGRDKNADVFVESTSVKEDHTDIKIVWKNQHHGITIPFTDNASYENAMFALLVLLNSGIDIDVIKWRMQDLKPIAMRLEQKEGRNGCLIIDDAYNSDITSLELALDFLKQQARKKEMKRVVILSDIFQSGIDKNVLYQRISKLIDAHDVDTFIGVGKDLSENRNYFDNHASFYTTTDDLVGSGILKDLKNQVVLLKGSRDFSFEKISELIEQKQHQTVMEINLNALRSNLNYFRNLIQPGVRLLAMVKAFSYGSGSFEIAGLLQHQNIDYLGVAFADEGVELRQAGISVPILVMSPEKKGFSQIIQYHLEPEIYSFKILNEFASALIEEGVNSYNVHIKIETGMNRLGFSINEIPELINQLKRYSFIKVKSVFSHLAGSENPEHDEFTKAQIAKFKSGSDMLIDGLQYPVWRHIINSAGIERFPEAQFEMVRLGIGLYGVSSIKRSGVNNIATLKTYISQIKPVASDETVGYGRRGRLVKNGKIAILPIGYADGLDRRLGNGTGEFLIKGEKVYTVGNICMDMCMVDVSGIDCSEDDEVIIFGDQITISEVADKMNTIPYEVLTGISRRVKRIYYQE